MDPGPPKSNSKPSLARGPADTAPTHGTVVEPFRDRPALSDTFLLPPQRPDELGRLGAYRILAELGRGGMGVVFRAEDPNLQRAVALKVLLPELAADPRARARFVREAQAQAKVEHDHIIPIHAVEESNGVAFIVMPLLKGLSLSAALKLNPRPPVAELLRIGREIAEGLSAAHAAGLIHRDIKPGNIWLEGNRRRVKILDFGVARSATAAGDQHTASGAIVGSPAYMSPEQARSRPTDRRADLFSLGVVLYEMATGALPFTGESAFDVLSAVVSHEPCPAHERAPGVPPALSALIARLMAKDPAGRPASADVVAQELDAIARDPTAPAVRVIAPGDAPGAPDPWTDLDDTQADEPDDATVMIDRGPARRAAPVWVWPAVAGLVALVFVIGLLVAKPWKTKQQAEQARDQIAPVTQPQKQTQTLPPVKLPVPKTDPDRRAAEWVRDLGRRGPVQFTIRQDGKEAELYSGNELPPGPLELVAVALDLNSEVTDAGLANLTGCANLTLLSLCGTNTGDAGLTHLKGLTELAHLKLSYTRVTGSGLVALKGSRKLRSAVIEGVDLGDDVAVLADLFPALEYARVTEGRVTPAGVERFAQKLPNILELAAPAKPEAPAKSLPGLAFDGTSTSVTVPKFAFDGKVPITLEAWVTPAAVREMHIILLGERGGFGTSGDNAIGAGFNNGGNWQNGYGRDKLKPGETVHVAAVVAAERIVLYVNGKESGTKEKLNLGALPGAESAARIGGPLKDDEKARWFHGTVHGLRVSRGARYEKGFTPAAPADWKSDDRTVVLYRFDEGTGATVTDHSPNKWNGEVASGKWVAPKK